MYSASPWITVSAPSSPPSYSSVIAGNIRYSGSSQVLEIFDGNSWHVVNSPNSGIFTDPDFDQLVGLYSSNKNAFSEMIKYFSIIAKAESVKSEIPAVAAVLESIHSDVRELEVVMKLGKE